MYAFWEHIPSNFRIRRMLKSETNRRAKIALVFLERAAIAQLVC